MPRVSLRTRIALIGILVFSAGAATLAYEKTRASNSVAHDALRVGSTVDSMTELRKVSHPTASDSQIRSWSTQARKTPNDDKAWVNLGDAYMQKVRETADASYYARAEAVYKKALEVNPARFEAMVGMAWVNDGRHEFEKSQDWANKALAIFPGNNDAYGLLGDAAVEMGNYDAAFTNYQKMLDLRPDISSYSRGAHLLQLTGNSRKATWLMQKAIKTGGPYAENTAWCRAQLGLINFSMGAYVPAEQIVSEGLKTTPVNYHLLFAMGRIKTAMKDYRAAISYYKKAIEIVPQLDAVIALGDLYTVIGEKSLADQQYSLVESIWQLNKANGVTGDIQIAQFYADHDRNLSEAMNLAEQEVKTRKNVYVFDTVAWCYYKNGRYEDARRFIDLALSKNSPEALFLFHKGLIYGKLGDTQTARTALYQASSLNPNFHPIFAPVAVQAIQQYGATAAPATPAVMKK